MKWRALIYIGLVVSLGLVGCAAQETTPEPIEGGSMSGGTLQEEEAGTFSPFTVSVEHTGDPVGVDFRGIATRGSVRVELVDAEGQAIWQETATAPAPFTINTVVNPPAGEYTLRLAWDGPLTLQYALKWQPGAIVLPTLSPLILLGGIGMVLVAIGFVVYVAARRLGWGYLGLGAAAWVVAVALKFAWAVPLNAPVYNALESALPETVAEPAFWVYIGLLTGVFEVALVWLLLRYTRLGQAPWIRALAFGIGFGATEAFLLGVLSLSNMIAALAAPALFPPEALNQIAQANNPLYGLASIWERFFTVLIHLFSNALLFYAVARKQPRWFWLAFIYKTLIDTAAAYAQVTGLTPGKIWMIEAFVTVWGATGWLGTRLIAQHYPEAPKRPDSPGGEQCNASEHSV